jgi:hypothetical protein
VRSVWPRSMAGWPRGGCPTDYCHGNTTAKFVNRLWDAINTPPHTHTIVGYPLVKALVP